MKYWHGLTGVAPVFREYEYKNVRHSLNTNINLNTDCTNKNLKSRLEDSICTLYDETRHVGWDGYGAEPLRYWAETLDFANRLLDHSRRLVETVDMVPEGDGSLCFSWRDQLCGYINICVQGDKLVYDYDILGEDVCGSANFAALPKLVEQIKRVI